MSPLTIRPATSSAQDRAFILAAWDSTLPYMAAIDAGEMWGDEPFSQRAGMRDEIAEITAGSEREAASDARRILIAEGLAASETAGGGSLRGIVPIGFAMLRDRLPGNLLERESLRAQLERLDGRVLFLEVLVKTQGERVVPLGLGKGEFGRAVVEGVKQRARESGKTCVVLDCWNGGGRGLNRYYHNLGFSEIGNFQLTRKNGSIWEGTVFRIDV